MTLILTLTTGTDRVDQANRARMVGNGGLVIGRGAGCDWILPDPDRELSKQHCRIEETPDGWRLTDTSTNGTLFGIAREALGKGNALLLRDGDQFALGPYSIEVMLTADDGTKTDTGGSGTAFDPFSDPGQAATVSASALPDPFDVPDFDIGSDDRDEDGFAQDPFNLATDDAPPSFSFDGDLAGAPGDDGGILADHGPVLNEAFDAPAPTIPDDWDPLAPTAGADASPDPFSSFAGTEPALPASPAAQPAILPLSQDEDLDGFEDDGADDPFANDPADPVGGVTDDPLGAPQSGPLGLPRGEPTAPGPVTADAALQTPTAVAPLAGDPMAAFFGALGLDPNDIPPGEEAAVMARAGEVLKEAIFGLRHILAERSEDRSRLDVEQTALAGRNNNALKIAGTDEDALKLLLLMNSPAFRPAPEAVAEATRDLFIHHKAMVGSMQAAVSAILKRFDPETLEAQMQASGLLGSILPSQRKARSWEVFCSLYAPIAEDASQDFMTLFSEQIAEAYKEALRS